MGGRIGTALTAAAVLFSVSAAGLVASTGTAAAAEPIVLGSCATSIQGAPGQPVSLSPSAVVEPITNLVTAIPLLGPPLAAPFKKAFTAMPAIPIGALPTGNGYITGGSIATTVVDKLKQIPLLGPVIGVLVGGVQNALTAGCGVTVQGVNSAAAPIQNGTQAIADASQKATGGGGTPNPGGSGTTPGGGTTTPGGGGTTTPGGGGTGSTSSNFPTSGGLTPGGVQLYQFGGGAGSYDYGRVPLFSYTNLPFAVPGEFAPSPGALYGGSVPGYAPQVGTLSGTTPDSDGVQTAGRAQALPSVAGGGVAAPVLIAVLALAGVTAALVRTWVLRRTGVA
ncbi:hypothetical protein [Kutzneria albida]|uniref:Secreted protein n=1 Tax=Kutzneria albida DSM 43870 TaxID=1449976 RepID=W5WVF8_9PSEU|nr:hypothetical protein [Kutzneria albida]AHI02115.1 hypothetical protein KALB_8758 [Kutzneria albida DSM 43870]